MADWLILLLKYGGFGAVLVLALFLMGKWLFKRITAALDYYVSAYAQQSASIDARIANLEKLAEEQARLTRTVESIKDEIAAQAKSRDNRWEFRKTVYVNLLDATTGLAGIYTRMATFSRLLSADPTDDARLSDIPPILDEHRVAARQYSNYAAQAPLALADDVLPLVAEATSRLLRTINLRTPEAANYLDSLAQSMQQLLSKLQTAGRKDLWGTPRPPAKAEAAI